MQILFAIVRSPFTWILLALGIFALPYALFILLPGILSHRKTSRNRKHVIWLMERLLRLPGFGTGDTGKIILRYRLGNLNFQEGRHAEAVQQYQLLLQQKLPPGVEADVRRRLADNLDGIGEEDIGNAERQKARDAAGKADDVAALMSRGDLLKRERRYNDAQEQYELALVKSSHLQRHARAEIMVKMCLAAFEAGQIDQTIAWAEQAIENGARGTYLRSAHAMAGVGHGNIGDLNRAEYHNRRAYDLAIAAGENVEAARRLATLATNEAKRGRLRQALEMLDESIARLGPTRVAYTAKSDVLLALGRFEEAKEALTAGDALDEPGQNIAYHKRRQRAVIQLGLARIYCQMDRPGDAWRELQEAYNEFDGDAKLTLWCDATAARALSMMNRRGQAEQMIRRVQAGMARFSDDRNGRLMCLSMIGFAALSVGDNDSALHFWEEYLSIPPDLNWRPCGLFHVGECRRQLGDTIGARHAYEEACSLGFETYYSERARAALSEAR